MMRITAGVQSAEEVAPLLAAGAGEFFGGLLSGRLESSSRPATAKFHFPDAAAFARAAEEAAAGGAELHLALNEPCGERDRAAFDRLVDTARGAGAAGVILGDLELLARFRREGRDLGRVAVSCMAGALNAAAFRPFADLGADRFILDRETLPGEMAALGAAFPGVTLEAFAFLDKCNHVDAFCRAMDLLASEGGSAAFAAECLCLRARRGRLSPHGVAGGGKASPLEPHLPALLDRLAWRPGCAACRVPALAAAGVTRLKVAGRGWPLEAKAKAVASLAAAVRRHEEGRAGEIAPAARAAFRDLFGRDCGAYDCYGGERKVTGEVRRASGPPAGSGAKPRPVLFPPPGGAPACFPRDPGALAPGSFPALAAAGFTRIYLGSEFCARLQPPPERLVELSAAARAAGLAVTFVTPPLFESEFAAHAAALGAILAETTGPAEVVVNDLGLLRRLLAGDFPGAVPVVGRALASLADYADGASALAAAGIARVETDTPGDFPARPPFALSHHGPWRFLNFTRFCPFAEIAGGHPPGGPCGFECRLGGYVFEADGMRERVVGYGNAHHLGAPARASRPHPAVDRRVVNDLGGLV